MSVMRRRVQALEAGANVSAAGLWLRRIACRETRAEVLDRHGLAPDADVHWIERQIVAPVFDENGVRMFGVDGKPVLQVEADMEMAG